MLLNKAVAHSVAFGFAFMAKGFSMAGMWKTE